jgi:hypothetical protein
MDGESQRVSLPPLRLNEDGMDQLEQPGAHDAYILKPENDEEERRAGILNALASTLVRKRSDAVSGRAATCIEIEWLADEEFYQGYDDANRNEFVNTANKPMSGGGATEDEKRLPVRGSTVFPNITQPYVDSAAARVGDMLLPTDDRNFAIEPTPVPEMFEELERMLKQAGMMTAAQPALVLVFLECLGLRCQLHHRVKLRPHRKACRRASLCRLGSRAKRLRPLSQSRK